MAMDQVGVGWSSGEAQRWGLVPHLLPVPLPGFGGGVKPRKPGPPAQNGYPAGPPAQNGYLTGFPAQNGYGAGYGNGNGLGAQPGYQPLNGYGPGAELGFPGANGFRNGESDPGDSAGVRRRDVQGLGRNRLDLLQGMGRKRLWTPELQLQPLKETVRNECLGSRVNPSKGRGGQAEWAGALRSREDWGVLDVQDQWAGAHASSLPAGQAGSLRGSPWPSLQPWGAALKPGYGAGGAYPGVRSQPGPYGQLRPELGFRPLGEWGSARAWNEVGVGKGTLKSSGDRVP
ncbi:hypothetical protein HPG69_009577 [Diceros bicornis minor]|uniref:Uncharacterized protein n=1 Tax=Diceros bicornis minor TaxID=77932 RepID=A0A7J7FM21_DICBM|nr:hypothetical protein HPG69_009577 [Diceros bicornis minor]